MYQTGYPIIPYVTLNTIMDDAMRIMSAIGVYRVDDLFAIDPDYPPQHTKRTIIERSNATVSRHFPLYYIQRIHVVNGRYTFVDNFQDYINNVIQPHEVTLIPDAVVSISPTPMITPKFGTYKFIYQPPTLVTMYPITITAYAKTLCKYKLYYDNNNIDNDAVYFMDKNTPVYDIFIKQVVMDIAYFISNLKNNYQLTELPIEVFAALENIQSELRTELETLYNENPRNYLILY